MFYNLFMNQVLIFPFMVSLSSIVGAKQRFDAFPSSSEVLLQIAVVYLIDDFFFYCGHRLFH